MSTAQLNAWISHIQHKVWQKWKCVIQYTWFSIYNIIACTKRLYWTSYNSYITKTIDELALFIAKLISLWSTLSLLSCSVIYMYIYIYIWHPVNIKIKMFVSNLFTVAFRNGVTWFYFSDCTILLKEFKNHFAWK